MKCSVVFGGVVLATLVAVKATSAEAQMSNSSSYKSLYHACMKISLVVNSPISFAINHATCRFAFPFKGTQDQQCMQLTHTVSYEADKISRQTPTPGEKAVADMFVSLREDVAYEFGCDMKKPPMVTVYIAPDAKLARAPQIEGP